MEMDDQETMDGYRMAGHEILMIMLRLYDLYTLTTHDTRRPFKRLYNDTYEYSSYDL
jgi:hypothetical protein